MLTWHYLVIILTFLCWSWGKWDKAWQALSIVLGHKNPSTVHPHFLLGTSGRGRTLPVACLPFYPPYHSVFNHHRGYLMPSPFILNPYYLLSQTSSQLIVSLSSHWGNRIIRRELPHLLSPSHFPACLHLYPCVLPSLLLLRPRSYVSSADPTWALDPVPSGYPDMLQ